MATDALDFRMTQSAKNGHLVPEFVERFQGFVEGEIPAFALGKPVPLGELTLLIGQAHSIGEVDGAKSSAKDLLNNPKDTKIIIIFFAIFMTNL